MYLAVITPGKDKEKHMKIDHSSYDKNRQWTMQQLALGGELEQLIAATVPTRGGILDPFRLELSGIDRANLDAALTAAGFWHDQGGVVNWFQTLGTKKVKLEADNEFGKAGQTVAVPDWVHIPSPG